MDKEKVITRICDAGIVAVVRAENAETAMRITDACIEGGVEIGRVQAPPSGGAFSVSLRKQLQKNGVFDIVKTVK